MADDLDEIRSRVRIVELVGQVVKLKKSGRSWSGLCPFHQDKNPSFSVSDETGRYRCWSCGEKGDCFNWVMKTQNVDFPEALRILAQQVGYTLTGGQKTDSSLRDRLRAINVAALEFFVTQLQNNQDALAYCAQRGIDAETIKRWELGYAPTVDAALTLSLRKAGHSLSEAKELFLVEADQSGGYYDKFRGRLMFPIRDERGQVVAFGGRIIGEGHPKYVNSSETPLFRKSKTLYGLFQAKDSLRAGQPAILCEGYLDVIACSRAGAQNAVASLGTSLTEDHAKMLARWTDSVVILYDADDAGSKAAARAAEVLRAEDLKVRIVSLPAGEDPDTLLHRVGPGAVMRAIEGALSPTSFRIERLLATTSPNDEQFWKDAVAVLAASKDELEVLTIIQRLAPQYPNIKNPKEAADALRSMVFHARRGGPRDPQRTTQGSRARVALGMKSADVAVFSAFLSETFRVRAWHEMADPDLFISPRAQELASIIRATFPEAAPAGKPAAWLGKIEPEAWQEILDEIANRQTQLTPEFFQQTLELLSKKKAERDLERLKGEATGDERLKEVSERLKKLKNT